jgi:uncharacterized membrane protein YoaK (UPF0700 family)
MIFGAIVGVLIAAVFKVGPGDWQMWVTIVVLCSTHEITKNIKKKGTDK